MISVTLTLLYPSYPDIKPKVYYKQGIPLSDNMNTGLDGVYHLIIAYFEHFVSLYSNPLSEIDFVKL